MKTIKKLPILLLFSLFCYSNYAQDTTQVKLDDKAKMELAKLEKKLQEIETEEKNKLKKIISELNAQQAKDSLYSSKDFETIKLENAERIAQNIKNRQAIVQNQIDFLKRNGYLSDEVSIDNNDKEDNRIESIEISKGRIDFSWKDEDDKKYRNRTQSDLIFAFGLNNAIPSNGGINDSPFKVGGSRFFEIGYLWSSPLDKKNFFRLDYGFSFQFNGLKPEDDLIFFEDGEQTVLDNFERDGQMINLDKNKFRQDNLIFPVHLHINTKKSSNGDYYTRSGFNLGFGGFVGLNLNNIQKLKYDFNGDDEKDKFKDDYNTNNFLYGLSAYAGFGDVNLYFTYSLNPIFENNPVDINNVQLGLRFAF
ncbi:MAG: hypothetical protein KGY51_02935 [Psychroflexus sp.]|nr:hypothetical protein [Psychroflexus sp.]